MIFLNVTCKSDDAFKNICKKGLGKIETCWNNISWLNFSEGVDILDFPGVEAILSMEQTLQTALKSFWMIRPQKASYWLVKLVVMPKKMLQNFEAT